jgi:hypothetical protein
MLHPVLQLAVIPSSPMMVVFVEAITKENNEATFSTNFSKFKKITTPQTYFRWELVMLIV